MSKKNETKKSDTKRDSVSLEKGKSPSNHRATKKSDTTTNIGKPDSGAGKGDKLRRGITQDEWEKSGKRFLVKRKRKLRRKNDRIYYCICVWLYDVVFNCKRI